MKKLLFILLLPCLAYAQTNTTPQFKRNVPADSLLGYSIPGITGNHWLPDTAWVKHHVSGGSGGGTTTNGLSLTYGFTGQPLSFNGSAAITGKIDSTILRTVLNSPSLSQLQTKFNLYTPTSRQIINGYGITGGHNFVTDITLATDSSLIQTVLNFFPKGDTRYYTKTASDARFSPIAGSSSITTVGTLGAGSIPYSLLTGTPSLSGYLTAIGVTTANGVSGISSGGTTPNLTITLGNITPTSLSTTIKPTTIYQTPLGTAGTDSVMVKHAGGTVSAIPANYYSTGGGGLATSNFVYNETPSGTINGSNVTFTLANTPTTGKVELFKNGQLLTPTTDYTLSGGTITYVVAPTTSGGTDVLAANYLK